MERPDEVPGSATYNKKDGYWRDEAPAHERLWSSGGSVILDAPRNPAGKLHGEVQWNPMIEDTSQFESRVAIAKRLGLPDGPTNAQIATFDDGALVKVRFRAGLHEWLKDELVATVVNGKLHGELEWKVGSTNGEPLFSYQGAVVQPGDFKVPKPWPAKLVATFANGTLVTHGFFDKQGKRVGGDKPLADWGEAMTAKQLPGYIERGDFVADAKRFFPKAAKVTVENLPKQKLGRLAKLPAAVALETAVRKKQLPALGIVIDFSYFGADGAELDGIADAKYVGVGCDGSGDYYLLDTSTGKVHIYRHEESKLDKTAFASLDELAFAVLRVEAVKRAMIPEAAVKKALKALGITAAAALF